MKAEDLCASAVKILCAFALQSVQIAHLVEDFSERGVHAASPSDMVRFQQIPRSPDGRVASGINAALLGCGFAALCLTVHVLLT